jgi:hypothetical protein
MKEYERLAIALVNIGDTVLANLHVPLAPGERFQRILLRAYGRFSARHRQGSGPCHQHHPQASDTSYNPECKRSG